MTIKAIILLAVLIGSLIAFGILIQRRHDRAKLAIRRELARLGSARITEIKQDKQALVGYLNGFAYKLYSFDKGRGGAYLRIELNLSHALHGVMQLRSGMPNAVSSDEHARDSEFWSRFSFHGNDIDRSLVDDPDLQAMLLQMWRHAGTVELEIKGPKLVCDWADHGYSETKELMDLLIQLTWLARSVSDRQVRS